MDTLVTILPGSFLRQTTILIESVTALIGVHVAEIGRASFLSSLLLVIAVGRGGLAARRGKIAREAQDRLAGHCHDRGGNAARHRGTWKAFANEGYELNRHHEGLGKFLTAAPLRGAGCVRRSSAFIGYFRVVRLHGCIGAVGRVLRLLQQGEITFG